MLPDTFPGLRADCAICLTKASSRALRCKAKPHLRKVAQPNGHVLFQVARVQKMLGDEFGTASNIKSRVNRQSVLGAITSAQQRLKLYNRVGSILWHFCAELAAVAAVPMLLLLLFRKYIQQA